MGIGLPAPPMAVAQADFSLNLLRETLHPTMPSSAMANVNASFVVSPISLAITIAMAYAGAANETAAEISKAIAGGEKNSTLVLQYYGGLSGSLAGNGSYELEAANRLFIENKFRLDYHYKNKLKRYYQGHLVNIDFKLQPKETADVGVGVRYRYGVGI